MQNPIVIIYILIIYEKYIIDRLKNKSLHLLWRVCFNLYYYFQIFLLLNIYLDILTYLFLTLKIYKFKVNLKTYNINFVI